MTARTFKLVIAYDGTDFFGWQRQGARRTVQGELEAALERATGHRARTLASSRTDAGVHALGQWVGVRVPTRLSPEVLRRALNALLPPDVAVLEVTEMDRDFHPLRSVSGKLYRYVIRDGPIRNVFLRNYCWHFRRGQLDTEAMSVAAATLLGTHDFSSFSTSGSPRRSTVRTLRRLTVRRMVLPAGENVPLPCVYAGPFGTGMIHAANDSTDDHWVVFEAEADGFLYNMVRNLVGTLVEVGRGVQQPNWVREVLAAHDRRRAGPTAPPQGLFLVAIW